MSFNRRFIILNRDEGTYCNDGATGYCKIDVKDHTTKIKIFVQGLKNINKPYNVYLLNNENDFIYVYLGDINMVNNIGELEVDVDRNNVLSKGYDITKYNTVIICIENQSAYSFPLVGYNANKNDRWKNILIKELQGNKNFYQEQINIDSFREPEYRNEIKEEYDNIEKNDFKRSNIEDIYKMINNLRGVKEVNPFSNTKLKYKWWKIPDEKMLDNIISNSLTGKQIFNHPLIKKMLKESAYFIFGLLTDSKDNLRYMSYGFPSKYSVKDQFYIGGFANFYPEEGYERKAGAKGYWIIHVRVDNDNVVITV